MTTMSGRAAGLPNNPTSQLKNMKYTRELTATCSRLLPKFILSREAAKDLR